MRLPNSPNIPENSNASREGMTRRSFLATVGALGVGGTIALLLSQKNSPDQEEILINRAVHELAEHHHVPEEELRALVKEQLVGYRKMAAVAEKGESIQGDERKVIVPYSDIENLHGEDAANRARTEGATVLTCSDDRIPITPDRVAAYFIQRRIRPPANIHNVKKIGFPGLGVLLPKHQFERFSANVEALGPCLKLPHCPCGACNGDRNRAEETARRIQAPGPVAMSDYDPRNPLNMVGHQNIHDAMGFEISGLKEFGSRPLQWGRNMHLQGSLAEIGTPKENDEVLNSQAQALINILMEHGLSADFYEHHPLLFPVAGRAGHAKLNARELIRRLEPTWQHMQRRWPKAKYKAFGFDVEPIAA